MRRTILMTAITLLLATGLVVAPARAETPAEAQAAQLAKIEAARVKVAAKIAELQKLTNNSANGTTAANTALQGLFQQTLGTLNKRLQEENVKTGEARDQGIIDLLTTKYEKINALWNNFLYRDNPSFNAPFNDVQYDVTQLTTLVDPFAATGQPWVRLGMDPAQILGAYQAIEKRIDAVSAAASAMHEKYKAFCADRTRAINE